MKKNIYLYGSLKNCLPEEYNGKFCCDFQHPVEAVSAIEANFPGFASKIRTIPLQVVVGDDIETGTELDETQVKYSINQDLHIIPVMEGAGGRAGKIILGIGMLAVGVATAGTALAGGAAFGAAMGTTTLGISATSFIMGGVGMTAMGIMGPATTPEGLASREAPDQRPSSVYTGPLNTQEMGAPVPYVAGVDVVVGGVIIHADLQIEQL